MASSVLPAVIDALVVLFTQTLPAVEVIDGPYLEPPSGSYLAVGWTPDNAGDGADMAQDWAGQGAGRKSEDGTVLCYLEAATGDVGPAAVKAHRDACYVMFGQIEAALRADLQLKIGGTDSACSPSGSVQITAHRLRQEQVGSGFAVGITFTVTVSNARI